MSIRKINKVVLHQDLIKMIGDKISKSELDNLVREIDNKLNDVYANVTRKPMVSTFDDIRKTYPNAEEGWTVTVDDTNITYQYDADDDVWFPTSINALPIATPEVDGLMPKEAMEKVITVEKGAEKNKTPAQILSDLKEIDGEGSGLDADTVDGKHLRDLALADHTHDGIYYRKKDLDIVLASKGSAQELESHINDQTVHITNKDREFLRNPVISSHHNQIEPAKIWYVSHNLNKHPSVSIVDSGGNVVIGDVQYISNSEIVIKFTSEFSGVAHLN